MLPYFGGLSHLLEDHDHKTCDISQTHLHEIELDCDILDYQFASSIQISYENNYNVISSAKLYKEKLKYEEIEVKTRSYK